MITTNTHGQLLPSLMSDGTIPPSVFVDQQARALGVTQLLVQGLTGDELQRLLSGPHPVKLLVAISRGECQDSLVASLRFAAAPDADESARSQGERWRGGRRMLDTRADHAWDQGVDTDYEPEAHAATRWAKAVVPIIDCPSDPRTIGGWSRWIAASSGAVRNWCRTAGIRPRNSLDFGRLMRTVVLSHNGQYKPENVLDVVDRRTLQSLLHRAGLTADHSFPRDLDAFVVRQTLVRDATALEAIRQTLSERQRNRPAASSAAY